MNEDEKWDEFRRNANRIQKASIPEKLDTLAAALNEINANTTLIPNINSKIMGDEGALDAANSAAGQDALAPGVPPMMGGAGDEMMNADDDMPPEGMPQAGAPAPDMGGAPPMGGTDAPPMEGADVPPMAPGASPEGDSAPSGDDFLSDEDIEAILNGSYDDEEGDEDIPAEPPVGDTNPEVPAMGGAGLADAANNLLAAIKQAAHEAVDAGDMAKVMELSQLEQQMQQSLGGFTNLTEPDTTAVSAPADVPEEISPEALPPETGESGTDVSTDMPLDDGTAEGVPEEPVGDAAPEGIPEDEIPDDTPLPEADSDSDDSDSDKEKSEDKGGDKDDDKKDDKDDDKKDDDKKDDKDVKKSADCDIVEDDIAKCAERNLDADLGGITKSAIPPSPSFKDMLAGKFDLASFIKSDNEGYIDAEQIYKDPMVDAIDTEGVVDGGRFLMKSDSRIASAMNIFEKDIMTGRTNRTAIATSGTAQEALDHTGSTDRGSISQSEPIMEIAKSETPDISSSSGSTDPDSIASSGTAQAAMSHEGSTDPDSIAQPDPAVSMDGGDSSEGTTTELQKSEELAPAEIKPPAPVAKGRHMMTLKEMMSSIAKSNSRPFSVSSVSGELSRPTLTNNPSEITKSADPPVRMGRGVDPWDVIQNDLKEYNLYKDKNRF